VGYTFADTNSITAAEIPALYWTLGSPYHEGATWVTRGATLGSLQGLTGNNFQLVNTPPYGGIERNLFWGAKPYYLSDSVAAIATGAKTILIGNWAYYALVERRGLTLSRNPYLYQANGQIGLFCSVRMGGAVMQAEAFKYGKQA
jgi:HK97 family phage major capsid protein